MKASIFAAMLVAGVLSTPANAAQCGPKQIVAEQLGNRYGEVNFASGVAVGSTVKFFGPDRHMVNGDDQARWHGLRHCHG